MATPSERFKSWIEGLADTWKVRLLGWMASWASKGIVQSLESLEPGTIAATKETLTKLKALPGIPPEMSRLIDKSMATGDVLPVILGWVFTILGSTLALLGRGAPIGRVWEYGEDRISQSFRLDALSVITAWRRDPAAMVKWFDDLRDLGWTEERIATLKFITMFIPSAQDQINWLAKEVFEPEMIERYGLKDELPVYGNTDFSKIGVDETQMANYWMAHWEHAAWGQVVEMLHRGLLSLSKKMPPPPTTAADWATRDAEGLEAIYDWYRLVEIPPFWRARLTEMSWNVPTRVDVRRFWDMRTITEERMRSIYHAMGFHGVDLEDYILWTKVYNAFPELLARYKNGWITLDQVKAELVAIGMKPDRADEMIEEKIKKAAPERTVTEKDLTKTDIYKGVKQARITRDQGYELLQDIGYDKDEAVFLLDTNVPLDEEDKAKEERQLTKADILTGLKTEVITRDEARQKLIDIRYSVANTELLLKIFDAQVKPPVEVKLKEASKADIVSAVKKGLVTQEEGYIMLLDIGFSPEAALFILTVLTEESPFSPINYSEFKDLTQKYRKASGLEGPPMNDEIKRAAADVVRLTTERDAIQKSIDQEKRGLVSVELLPAEATARLTKLQASLRQVEAELSRVKSEYSRLVAEFKHSIS